MTENEAIAQARADYFDNDIEIDARPRVAEAEDGFWIQAWVRVAKPEETS